MAEVKIKLNRAGVKQLLRSDEMKAACKECADGALSRLGEGYEVTTYTGTTRVNASVKANSRKAIRENMENNTILKALR